MNTQRWIAFFMIALQAGLIEHNLFRIEWFPVALVIMAAVGMPGTLTLPLSRRMRYVAACLIAVFVWVGTPSFLFWGRVPVVPFLGPLTYPIGWYLLTLQPASLFLRTPGGRLSSAFPVMGAGVLAYVGLFDRHGAMDPVYHAGSLSFVILTLLFFIPEDRWSTHALPFNARMRGIGVQWGLLITALGAAIAFSAWVGIYRNEIDRTFFRLTGVLSDDASVGFSTRARLDSVELQQRQNGDQVVLRVQGPGAPGYLRGRMYDAYDRGQWMISVQEKSLPRIAESPIPLPPRPKTQLFCAGVGEPPYTLMTVEPAGTFEGCLFNPLYTTWVRVSNAMPTGDPDGNLRTTASDSGTVYDVLVAARETTALSEEEVTRFTALPTGVDPRVKELARQLFAGRSTTREKIAAVVGYFAANYSYQLGFKAPASQEPLTYFLLEQPPAHCELFASGAVLLLRLGGVPCRYVSGFLAQEHNRFGGYWVARNRDAHAWAEAFVREENNWVTVEATVSDGLPASVHNDAANLIAQAYDWLRYKIHQMKMALINGDWRPTRVLRKLAAPLALGLGTLIGAGVLLRIRWRRRKSMPRDALFVSRLGPEGKALLRLRQSMDRRLRRQGFVRAPDETVLSFAKRIQEKGEEEISADKKQLLAMAVEWYAAYNAIRFSGAIGPDDLTRLKELANGHQISP